MGDWSIDFDSPYYLFLLLALPAFWFVGRRSLQGLGPWRRHMALFFRMAVAGLIVVALAEPNWLSMMRKLTVLFVVDASDSIQRDELTHAIDYVNAAAKQRNAERGDRAGVVVFGREAAIEVPPVDAAWRFARIETAQDGRFTNLEQALRLAAAAFPADSAKRVVIVSDGNENLGQARDLATRMLESGVGIDCVPISYLRRGEVAVEKVAVPADIRRGTPFEIRVVVNNLGDRPATGKLLVTRELSGRVHAVTEEAITLDPGKRVFTLRQELSDSGMSTYEARFVPDDPAADAHSENNTATGFSRITGRGHVLVVEDASQAGRFDRFVELLRSNEIEVTLRDTRRPFDDLADLQQFDSVILADVARVTGDDANELTQFTDQQIQELVQNTEKFGCGLVVLGGPNSYGAGGWANTEIDKALPVDCQIQDTKVNAVGALMLVIDTSGSMSGPKIGWSKAAAAAAVRMLGNRDFVGIVGFDSEMRRIVPLQRNGDRNRTLARIDRIGAAGGTNMMPALQEAYRALQGVEASLKHVIVLTDGQTPRDNYQSLVSAARAREITTTGVAVGPDADRQLLAEISQRGAGKFYHVQSPRAIPRIFMKEARRVAMPLVFEDSGGIAIEEDVRGEVLSGIQGPFPPTTGYVLTTLKEDPLVEVQLATPRKPKPNATILATRQYGLGRTVALTTDVGQRWATDWQGWDEGEKLLLQTIRWSMRNHELNQQYVMSAEVRDGRIQVVVNAIDTDDPNLAPPMSTGTLVLPGGESQPFSLEQVGPGRFSAELPASEPGNYYLSVAGGGNAAPLGTAVSVSSTAELDRLFSYDEFLAQLAEATPKGGEPGRMIRSPGGIADTETLAATDVFRTGLAPATSRTGIWPLVLLASSLVFFGDVFCRRVHVTWDWVPALLGRISWMRQGEQEATDQRMARLSRSKAIATARYQSTGGHEPLSEPIVSTPHDLVPTAVADVAETAGHASELVESDSEEGFTARLLQAKKRVHEERRRQE